MLSIVRSVKYGPVSPSRCLHGEAQARKRRRRIHFDPGTVDGGLGRDAACSPEGYMARSQNSHARSHSHRSARCDEMWTPTAQSQLPFVNSLASSI